jgi:protein polybromo-1
MIAIKIQNNQYSTLDDMENDLLLLISNARKYNDPKSQIYKVSTMFCLWKENEFLFRMPVH